MEIEDMKQSVFALDNSQYMILNVISNCSYISICQGFRDVRNAYSTILDKIEKNYEKITNPKGVAASIQQELLY